MERDERGSLGSYGTAHVPGPFLWGRVLRGRAVAWRDSGAPARDRDGYLFHAVTSPDTGMSEEVEADPTVTGLHCATCSLAVEEALKRELGMTGRT